MPEPSLCTILSSVAELSALQTAWSALWRDDPNATPFQSPEWLLPWWIHFSEGELRSVAIFRRASLIGLIPAYLYNPPDRSAPKLLPLGVSTSDYIDGIFAPECTTEDISKALHLLLDDPEWEELAFPQLRTDSKLLAAFTRLRSPAIHVHPGETTSCIPATPISGLPHKLRKNIANYHNRASREGRLEFSLADHQSWLTIFSALCALHARRWREARQTGVLADPRVIAWHREAIPVLLEARIGQLACLRFNGEIIAVLYSLLDPPERASRTQYCYLIGVSPNYAELSPGTLLLAQTIERSAAQGIAIVDFLRGNEPYKQLWHPESTATTSVLCRRTINSPSPAFVTSSAEQP